MTTRPPPEGGPRLLGESLYGIFFACGGHFDAVLVHLQCAVRYIVLLEWLFDLSNVYGDVFLSLDWPTKLWNRKSKRITHCSIESRFLGGGGGGDLFLILEGALLGLDQSISLKLHDCTVRLPPATCLAWESLKQLLDISSFSVEKSYTVQ